MGKLLGPLSRSQFSNILSQATLGRVAKGSTVGIVTEAATEVGQQVLERYQAGLPIDTPDAIAEYTEAAYAGGFVGGLLGGVTTTAGEAIRTVQPTPKVEEGIQKKEIAKPTEVVVQPEDQKTAALDQAKVEQEKPLNFAVEKQGDKFVVNRQELDEAGNVAKQTGVGVFNTEEEAKARQVEIQDQKSKLPEQSFFTKDEIIKENPALGNIITDLENQGNKIAPQVQQVYFTKNLALPKGDTSNVVASGGTAGSVADGWYDRVSDLAYISLADTSKAAETTAHENFHALQRQLERGKQGLFKEDEQTALNTFLPGGKITDIAPSVQKGLGNDVMARLQERHGDTPLSSPEMQAYAFGAYSALKGQGKRMAAPNPVIRAFKRLWDFIKSAGNVFKKNEVNSVQDLFEKARTGEIGKRAVPREEAKALRPKAIAAAEKAAAKGVVPEKFEYALSTVLDREGKSYSSVLPSLPVGDQVVQQSYKRGLGGSRLANVLKLYTKGLVRKERFPTAQAQEKEAASIASDLSEVASNEIELNKQGNYISLTTPEGRKLTIGNQSGRNLIGEYRKESELIGRAYDRLVRLQEEGAKPELALSTVSIREDKPNIKVKEIKDIGKYLDKLSLDKYGRKLSIPKLDKKGNKIISEILPEFQKDFDDAVDAAVEEISFQLGEYGEGIHSGLKWYDDLYQDALRNAEEVIPELKHNTDLKHLFTNMISIQSQGVDAYTNFKQSTIALQEFIKTGVLPLVNPYSKTGAGFSGVNTKNAFKLVNYLIKEKGGLENYITFLKDEHNINELSRLRKESGVFAGPLSKQSLSLIHI